VALGGAGRAAHCVAQDAGFVLVHDGLIDDLGGRDLVESVSEELCSEARHSCCCT
jgi:hypothetical protein